MGRDTAGDGRFLSPALQLEAMRRLAAQRGLREVGVVEDLDVSGRSFTRAGLDQVLAMCEREAVDVVAVHELSRVGRNAGEALRFIARLRELGVAVVSTVEQIDDSPEGQFMLGQFLGMAQLYSDQLGRRWQAVIAHRAADGRHHGIPPTGYHRGEHGRLHPHPQEGPLVTELFARYAAQHPIAELARWLTTALGRPVHPRSIKRVLRNPVYLGHVTAHGRIAARDAHPPLVDEHTWARVQRRVERDATAPARDLRPTYALAGIVHCAHCGRRLRRTNDRGGRRRLVCPQRYLPGGGCTGIGTPRLPDVEDAVLTWLADRVQLLTHDRAAAAAERARRARTRIDAQRLTREITATHAALGRLATEHARGTVSAAAYTAGAAQLEAELEQLLAQHAEHQHTEDDQGGDDAHRAAAATQALLQAWPSADPSERRRLLRELIARVTVRAAHHRGEPIAQRITVEPR